MSHLNPYDVIPAALATLVVLIELFRNARR
jgi:hypothetical protein